MPLYFAYGANMDRAAMAARCPRSRALGVARLARHRFIIMAPGWASVAADPRADVHGVLWDLALSDVPALDRYEEIRRGLYRKVVQPVLREPSGFARALVYVGVTAQPCAPDPAYLASVIAAGRSWSLPAPYIAY
ncbi:MAG: gamma-glutamylcyclotransferase, partial [Methylocystis sp.]|nr:gamma-glutamylcyclotransferase [Methylocystis sp.]